MVSYLNRNNYLARAIALAYCSLSLWIGAKYFESNWARGLMLGFAPVLAGASIRSAQQLRREQSLATEERVIDAHIRHSEQAIVAEAAVERLMSHYRPWAFPPPPEMLPDSPALALTEQDVPNIIAGYDGHLLVASRTGSGKTTLIQGAIAAKHAKYDGLVDFHIFDPKGASWLGLEHDADYLFCNSADKVPELLQRLSVIEKLLETRQEQRINQGGHWTTPPMPVVVILDEFNTLKALCSVRYEKDANGKRIKIDEKAELCRLVERIIFQGREDNVHCWLMSQTTRVEKLGLDTSVQDNLMYVAMARLGDYQSVEDALSNSYVVGNSQERKALWELLMADKASGRNKAQPIAFTTLQGNQLCLLPDLSSAKHIRLQVRTMNQGASSELDGLRSQLERQFSLNTHPDVKPPSEPVAGDSGEPESDPIDYSHIPKILQPIIEFAIKKKGEWVTAREVRNNVRFYKDGGHSTDQIRLFFQQLINYGVGAVDGEGDRLRYRI